MNSEKQPRDLAEPIPEVLSKHYEYLVVDPYSVNLIDKGPRIGNARLSFYSAFILNAANEIKEAGITDNIVLFSDASFDRHTLNTGELMLLKSVHPREEKRRVHPVIFNDPDLNNTPAQVRKLADFIDNHYINPSQVLYLAWPYHSQRVKNHLTGYGLKNVQIASAVDVHKYFRPQFNKEKLDEVLPNAEIEQMENFRRKLSRFDKKGRIPLLLKPVLGGSFTLDNVRGEDGRLHLMYKQGKERIEEVYTK